MSRFPLISAVVLWLAAGIEFARGTDGDSPEFKFTTKRHSDQIQVAGERNSATLTIQSPIGISEATVERLASTWPTKLALHLHVKGLERFSISNGKTKFNASVSSTTPGKVRMWKDEKEDMPLSSTDGDWMSVVWVDGNANAKDVQQQTGHFAIRLPDSFLADDPKTITLNWIDFYRT